jgi:hypothetical protein
MGEGAARGRQIDGLIAQRERPRCRNATRRPPGFAALALRFLAFVVAVTIARAGLAALDAGHRHSGPQLLHLDRLSPLAFVETALIALLMAAAV